MNYGAYLGLGLVLISFTVYLFGLEEQKSIIPSLLNNLLIIGAIIYSVIIFRDQNNGFIYSTDNGKNWVIEPLIGNYDKITFEIFFESGEYWEKYNVFSGGRIEKFNEDEILFAIGYAHKKDVSQQLDSLLGKIIKINLSSKNHEIISIGHRNPQGLKYFDKYNIILVSFSVNFKFILFNDNCLAFKLIKYLLIFISN